MQILHGCSLFKLNETLQEMKKIYDYDERFTYIKEDTGGDKMACPVVRIITEDPQTKIIVDLSKVIDSIQRERL